MKIQQYYKKDSVRIFMAFFLFAMLNALPALAQKAGTENNSELKATDLERIQTGTPAPDFNLESVDGNWIKLSNYQNNKNVILVFYRGYW